MAGYLLLRALFFLEVEEDLLTLLKAKANRSHVLFHRFLTIYQFALSIISRTGEALMNVFRSALS